MKVFSGDFFFPGEKNLHQENEGKKITKWKIKKRIVKILNKLKNKSCGKKNTWNRVKEKSGKKMSGENFFSYVKLSFIFSWRKGKMWIRVKIKFKRTHISCVFRRKKSMMPKKNHVKLSEKQFFQKKKTKTKTTLHLLLSGGKNMFKTKWKKNFHWEIEKKVKLSEELFFFQKKLNEKTFSRKKTCETSSPPKNKKNKKHNNNKKRQQLMIFFPPEHFIHHWFVSSIIQKLLNRFPWDLDGGCFSAQISIMGRFRNYF